MTLGEALIRTDFNAESSGDVDNVKAAFAKLVDELNEYAHVTEKETERNRLLNAAIYELEMAAMLAVKAVTTK